MVNFNFRPFGFSVFPTHVVKAEEPETPVGAATNASPPASDDNQGMKTMAASTLSGFRKFLNLESNTEKASASTEAGNTSEHRAANTAAFVPGAASTAVSEPEATASSDDKATSDASKQSSATMDEPPHPYDYKKGEPLVFEQLNREYQALTMQDNFDGFRLETMSAVNTYLAASHSFVLGTQMREGGSFYQFGPTIVASGGSLVLVSRVGADGTTSGRIMKRFKNGWELKGNYNSSLTQMQRNIYEIGADKICSNWTGSLKGTWQGTWLLQGGFSQVITPNLQLGGELTYVCSNGASVAVLSGRYTNGNNIFTGQIIRQPDMRSMGEVSNIHAGKLQYVRKVTNRLTVASEFEYTPSAKESGFRVGWEYLFRNARIQSLIDSSGKISIFTHDILGLSFSGIADYWRNDYKFGVMIQAGAPSGGDPNASQPTKEQ